jgi:hypothetical protein
LKLRRDAAVYEPSDSSVVELSRLDFVDERVLFETRLTEAVRRRAFVATPWLVAAGLLVMIGILLGVLSSRPSPDLEAAARLAATAPTVSAGFKTAAPAVVEAPAPPVTAAAPPTTADSASPTPRSAPPRWSLPSRAPAPVLQPRAALTSTPPEKASPAAVASSPPPASSSKPACSPPFYFDGTKKLYKAGCL